MNFTSYKHHYERVGLFKHLMHPLLKHKRLLLQVRARLGMSGHAWARLGTSGYVWARLVHGWARLGAGRNKTSGGPTLCPNDEASQVLSNSLMYPPSLKPD